MDPKLDASFNVTITYRRDSDVIRRVGEIENSIRLCRFDDTTGELIQNDTAFFADLLAEKFDYGESYNTAWYVSNCDHTSGALKRWKYGQALIDAGLKDWIKYNILYNILQKYNTRIKISMTF